TSTTGHSNYITQANDLLISGDLEVKGTGSFGTVASAAAYKGNAFSSIAADCLSTTFLQWTRQSGAFSCATPAGGASSLWVRGVGDGSTGKFGPTVATLSFDGNYFTVFASPSDSAEPVVKIDWGNGTTLGVASRS